MTRRFPVAKKATRGDCVEAREALFYFRHGFDDQIPTVTYAYNDRASGRRTIGSLEVHFIKVATRRLGGTQTVRTHESSRIIYSSKARTLMDAVYDWARFNSLPRGYEWIQQQGGQHPAVVKELVDVTVRYANQSTMRRVGYTLDRLVQLPQSTMRLQRRLSDSSALIPWIPGKPARGKADRKWGIIVNG